MFLKQFVSPQNLTLASYVDSFLVKQKQPNTDDVSTTVVHTSCAGLLSCDYTKTLWVYFFGGHIEAGWGADVRHNRLIEYIDSDPYVIKSVAFGTGDGVTGDFHFTSLRGNNNDGFTRCI